MGSPPSGLTPAGALRELCSDSLPYLSDGGGPVPFDADLVSLPAPGSEPADPISLLAPEHSELIKGSDALTLRSVSDAKRALLESGLDEPYVDPKFHSGHTYGKFVCMLLERSLVEPHEG